MFPQLHLGSLLKANLQSSKCQFANSQLLLLIPTLKISGILRPCLQTQSGSEFTICCYYRPTVFLFKSCYVGSMKQLILHNSCLVNLVITDTELMHLTH